MNNKTEQKPDMLDNVFRVSSALPLPFILLMLVAPRAKFTRRIMGNNGIFMVMGGIYTGLLVRGIVQNPGGIKDVMNPKLDGIAKLLGERGGAATGWVHMTAGDLFIARWIYLDSLERGKPVRLSVLMQFLAGPLGLLSYLAFGRRGRKRRGPLVVKSV